MERQTLSRTYPEYATHLLHPNNLSEGPHEVLELWCMGVEGVEHAYVEYRARPNKVTCPVCRTAIIARMEWDRKERGQF